jgi:hypothetical protein
MLTKRLVPLTLAGALLAPVFSLGLGIGADVADAASCPTKRRTISRMTLPAHGGFTTSKTFTIRGYSGTGTPAVLHYGLGRDASTPYPSPTTGALSSGNMLIGGHNTTRLFYNKNSYDYHMVFLKQNPKPSSTASLARRTAWLTKHNAWMKARKLKTTPHAKKNPAPFAHIQTLRSGQIIKVRSGCWVHSYKVLAGTHETINPNQATYALRPPQKTKATSVFTSNATLLRSVGVTSATALSSSSKLLTMYGCVQIGNDYAAKRKIVRAVWVSKSWTTAA